MRRTFSTNQISVRDKFRAWRDVSRDRLPPFEMRKLGNAPFHASLQTVTVGGLLIGNTTFGAHKTETNASTVRTNDRQCNLVIAFRFEGYARCRQYDRATLERVGGFTVLDNNAPLELEFTTSMRTLRVELPRERLERMLGTARLFAALPTACDQPGATLARTFFKELATVGDKLSPEMAERMSRVGVDLLVAAIGERMARDTPNSIHGTVTVQRAKAYIQANLGDHDLDPPKLAAAVGVSLRRLQELFHAHGRHISDWIWERRLETAAQRLADPGQAHLSLGVLSYGCGFASQTHFSTRFRARFGMSPSEYRRGALLGGENV